MLQMSHQLREWCSKLVFGQSLWTAAVRNVGGLINTAVVLSSFISTRSFWYR